MVTDNEISLSPAELRSRMLLAALDLIDQGFTLFDSDLKLVAANSTFARLLDFPEELMQLGTPFDAFIRYNARRGEYGPGEVEELVAERVRAAKMFRSHYTERTRQDGQVIAIRGEPLPDLGFITLYTDITPRRHAERVIQEHNADLEKRVRERTDELETAYQELRATNRANEQIAEDLRRSEARLRLITDAIPARIACVDKLGIYRFANRGYAEWLGKTKEQLIGQKVSDVIGTSLYAEVGPYLERALKGEKASFEYATPGKPGQGNGGMRYTYTEVVPEISTQGQVLGTFVLSTDITEQKRTQVALMQAQKMEAVGQLAGGIAHDLNNMLTVVLGNLSMLEERVEGTEDAEELVAPALLAVRRGATLIKRLLTFSRQHPLERRPVDLKPLLDGLTAMLRQTLPASIVLSLHMEEQLACVMTDANQLENALLNLAFNARDAMPSGGTLSLKVEMLPVNKDMASPLGLSAGNFVQITMTDNGCGMNEDTLLRACEPFFTTKGFGTGSGLGLSMVYGFARQSGGTLTIHSAIGQGTTVSLLLPAIEKPLSETAQTVLAVPAPGGLKPLVLLVEDDPGVRRVVRRQLLELGHTVVEAVDGLEALTMLQQVQEVGILVSDVIMPGEIDGTTLATRVRSLRPKVGILLISGSEYLSSKPREFKFLGKPFTKDELGGALTELMT
jgi:PAS domain S-box-containing protein